MMSKSRKAALSPRAEGLEPRELMAAPVLAPIADVSVPANKTLLVPLTATDADGNALHYAVSQTGAGATGTILTGTQYLKLSVANYGDMVFQLLPDFAPNTVDTIVKLVNQGFYNGLTIHRVVPTFVIQGGDPLGTGMGGPGFQFADEFDARAIFSGNGQLAMANSGRDTNGSQFFVTVGPQRFLDFKHTIWGQLVRGTQPGGDSSCAAGFSVLNAIDNAPNTGSPSDTPGVNDNTPKTPIVITSASIIQDNTDAVLLLKGGASGSSQVTVTVDDGHGGTSTKTFTASAVADPLSNNDPPFLGPVTDQVTATGTPITIPLTSTDLEGDAVTYSASVDPSVPSTTDKPVISGTVSVSGNVVTVTPASAANGWIYVKVGVVRKSTPSGVNVVAPDTQTIAVHVKPQDLSVTPSAITGVAGQPMNPTVATFTAAVPFSPAAYSVTIAWGDGTTTDGIVNQATDGSYVVTTDKTFDRFGTLTPSITIRDVKSGVVRGVNTTATIADAPITPQFVAPTPGDGSFTVSGTVATFTDGDPKTPTWQLSALIHWGDGSTSPGSISQAAGGVYSVTAQHAYAGPGSYPASVTITSTGGSTATANGTVTIGNHAPTFAPIALQSVAEGSPLSFTVSAHDIDPGQRVTYSLGADAPSGMTIDPVSGVVTWTPTSATTANFGVIATDDGTPATSATLPVRVVVSGVAPNVTADPAGSLSQFQTFTASGSFADPGAGPWTATVNYGDGSGVQALALNPDRSFTLSHAYRSAGAFSAVVTVTDSTGLKGSATVPVQVAAVPTVSVLSASPVKRKRALMGYNLTLSGAIDPASVPSLVNYAIVSPGRDRKFGTADDLTTRFGAASYVQATNTITLSLAKKVPARGPLQLQVTGLRDIFGRQIATFAGSISKAGGVSALAARRKR